MSSRSLLSTALLLTTFTMACDRTHPEVKLLTEVRESITSPELQDASNHPGAITFDLDAAPYPDELFITETTSVLSINEGVEDLVILDKIDFEESPKARHAFELKAHEMRLVALSGLERKTDTTMLVISPDASATARTTAARARRAILAEWDTVALRVSANTALDLSPLPMCDIPTDAKGSSFTQRCDLCEAGADAALLEQGSCKVPTLHQLDQDTWTATLRPAHASGPSCLSLPRRASTMIEDEPERLDELDEPACLKDRDPVALLDALQARHTLCDTVIVAPNGSTAQQLVTTLGALSDHPAARHLTLNMFEDLESIRACVR